MKYFLLVVALVIASYFAYQELKPPPPPPPPPVLPAAPPPVVNPDDLNRVIKASKDEDPAVRWEAFVFMDKIWSEQIAKDVIFDKLHHDPDSTLRARIAEEILSKHQEPDVSQNLVWSLKDLDHKVRISALKALSIVGDLAAAPNVSRSLKDSNEEVRVQALKTLDAFQEKQAQEIARQKEEAAQKAEEEERRKKNWWLNFE